MRAAVSTLLLLVALCGCSTDDRGEATPVITGTASAPAEPDSSPASPTGEEPAVLTNRSSAEEVIRALKETGLPITDITIYTKRSDPNERLGKPDAYKSKGAFEDTRIKPSKVKDHATRSVDLGGVVEMFSDSTRAARRASYIERVGIASDGRFSLENAILSGGILLRLSKHLRIREVKEYRAALSDLTGRKATWHVRAMKFFVLTAGGRC